MKIKTLFRLFSLFLILFSLEGFSQGKFYIIEKGVVKGNYDIKLVDQNVELKPDNFFSITSLNLITNKPFGKDVHASGYKRKGLISYKITIERLSDHKIYYGRIAFYGVINKPVFTSKAVASYYNIAIPETSFSQAHDGITSVWGEKYYKNDIKKAGPLSTWVIWFSDVPLEDVQQKIVQEKPKSDDKDDVMYQGRHNIALGIGFFNLNTYNLKQPISYSNVSSSTVNFTQFPPIFFKYEFAIKRRFTLGLNFSFLKANAVYNYIYQDYSTYTYMSSRESIDYRAISLSIKANWHFAVGKHFEMYGGPGIGFNRKTTTLTSNRKDSNGDYIAFSGDKLYFSGAIVNRESKEIYPILDVSIGARGYITKNIGIYAELGVVHALFQCGVVAGF